MVATVSRVLIFSPNTDGYDRTGGKLLLVEFFDRAVGDDHRSPRLDIGFQIVDGLPDQYLGGSGCASDQ
jgi:hypothetical protein